MDWDNAMRQMIVTVVQEQLAPLRRDITDLQNVNNELVTTLKSSEGALKLCSDTTALLTHRADIANQRMDKLANDAGDLWNAIGIEDVEGPLSIGQAIDAHAGRLNGQDQVLSELHSRIVGLGGAVRQLQDAYTASGTSDLQKRVAALEFTGGGPVAEGEDEVIDEAVRGRVQPLRDDLDDIDRRTKQYAHDTDDRLAALEGNAIGLNKDLTRVIEIATKDVQSRLNALEARHAPEVPAKAPETIENICAALEAEYVAFVRGAVKSGLSQKEVRGLLLSFHTDHAYQAFMRTDELINRMYARITNPYPEAA